MKVRRISRFGINLESVYFVICMAMFIAMQQAMMLRHTDETWNFRFALNCSNGLVPYRDFNMVVTPLAPWLGGLWLSAFGQELWIYRILGGIGAAVMCYLLYSVIGKFTNMVNTKIKLSNMLVAFLTVVAYGGLTGIRFDYNMLSVILILASILVETKQIKHKGAVQGVVTGLLILTKHNIGAMWLLLLVGVRVVQMLLKKRTLTLIKLNTALRKIHDFRDEVIGVVVSCGAVGLVWLVYLVVTGSFDDALQYLVFGVNDFAGNKVVVWQAAVVLILAVVVVGMAWLRIGARAVYFLIALVFCYPIADTFHMGLSLVVIMPLFMYVLRDKTSKLRYLAVVSFVFVVAGISNYLGYFANSENSVVTHYNHYKNVPISKDTAIDLMVKTDTASKLIEQGYEPYIFDYLADIAFIPMDIYHKDYDLINIGNTRFKTAEEMVDSLLSERDGNIAVMITDLPKDTEQTYDDLESIVREKMTKIGEVTLGDMLENKQIKEMLGEELGGSGKENTGKEKAVVYEIYSNS